ncbi:Ankyrin repeat domain-containing protein 34B [Hondaea fermentalgiana]|uniref:Ankyrin repeat domain-containing protein 34B n=1 Tax=Hondaea fermentalgiana TaxID=2315210 RepID=A0A2R5G6X7_9STRA|nr:Ankyrin repeat domain-containing protein 34B [Hondaea fermentalgiana]|eukprot:GBG26069.1 Ankyrin repeat domain-containing protein 34B [Hondaea fermentalgiana]
MGSGLSAEARELHKAALEGALKEAGRLVKKSARRDELLAETDGQGRTALLVAAGSKQADVGTLRRDKVVKLLVNFGSDLKHADARGWTALHHACSIGAVETAALLLERGGDPLARDAQGLTPLQVLSSQVQGREPINTFDAANDDAEHDDDDDDDDGNDDDEDNIVAASHVGHSANNNVNAADGLNSRTHLNGQGQGSGGAGRSSKKKQSSGNSRTESRTNLLRLPRALFQEARPLFSSRVSFANWSSKIHVEIARDAAMPRERIDCIVHFPSEAVLDQALDQLDFVQIMSVRQQPWNLAPLLTRFKRIANCRFLLDPVRAPRAIASFAAEDLLSGFHSFRIVYVCGEMSESPEEIIAASDVFHIEGDVGFAFERQSFFRPERPAPKAPTKRSPSSTREKDSSRSKNTIIENSETVAVPVVYHEESDFSTQPPASASDANAPPSLPDASSEEGASSESSDHGVSEGNQVLSSGRSDIVATGSSLAGTETLDEDEHTDGDAGDSDGEGHQEEVGLGESSLDEFDDDDDDDSSDEYDDEYEEEDGELSIPDMEEEWELIRQEHTCMHGAPWHTNDLPNPRMSNIYKLLLRERIFALSRERTIWQSRWTELVDPPPEDFELSIAAVQYQAKCALELDTNLSKARLALVPGKIQEETFWRAYFWHVELVKLDLIHMLNSGIAQERLDEMTKGLAPLAPTPPNAYFIPIPLPPISQVALLRHHMINRLESLSATTADDRATMQCETAASSPQDDGSDGSTSKRVHFVLDI